MSKWQDITVDIEHPIGKADWTAKVIFDALSADRTGEMFTTDIRSAVASSDHGDVAYIQQAIKGLRNIGHLVTTTKARHLSWYTLETNSAKIEDHHLRIAQEQYSERISWVRSLVSCASDPASPPSVQALYDEGIAQAIGLGRILGKRAQQVVNDCAPLETV